MKATDRSTRTRLGLAAGSSLLEKLLIQLGFDDVFIDGVIGDLAEEHAERREAHGAVHANAWRVREIGRSLPHWIRSALQRGDLDTRLRVAGVLALFVSIAVSGVIAYAMRDGAPSAIVLGGGDPVEGVVVNHTEPTMLRADLLDDRGHRLVGDTIEFRQIAGAPVSLSPRGVIHCRSNADATIRATAGGVSTTLELHCRPVKELRVSDWVDFVVGDAPRDLPFVALGDNDAQVTQLRGSATIGDSSIATLEGTRVHPRAAGATDVKLVIGDRARKMRVIVHAIVSSFVNLRDDQAHVAISVRLAQGDTIGYRLPRGAYWLKYLPKRADEAPPMIELGGGGNCGNGDGVRDYRVLSDVVMTYCVIQSDHAYVTLAHGMGGLPVIEGASAPLGVAARGRPCDCARYRGALGRRAAGSGGFAALPDRRLRRLLNGGSGWLEAVGSERQRANLP